MIKTQTAIVVTPAGLITSTDLAENSGLVLQAAVGTTLRDRMATRQRTCICSIEDTDSAVSCCLHAFNRTPIFIRATTRKNSHAESLGIKIKPGRRGDSESGLAAEQHASQAWAAGQISVRVEDGRIKPVVLIGGDASQGNHDPEATSRKHLSKITKRLLHFQRRFQSI